MFASIDLLLGAYQAAERVFIDVPIGLPWRDVQTRPCDRLARVKLGSRGCTVFSPPCREALSASGVATARQMNLETLGRSLSEQAWRISPKIAEVDEFLRANRLCGVRVREIHPEVCFWALAGGRGHAAQEKQQGWPC